MMNIAGRLGWFSNIMANFTNHFGESGDAHWVGGFVVAIRIAETIEVLILEGVLGIIDVSLDEIGSCTRPLLAIFVCPYFFMLHPHRQVVVFCV